MGDLAQTPPLFVRGTGLIVRLALLTMLSVTLMAADSRLGFLAEIRQGIAILLHPLEVVARSPAVLWRHTASYFNTHDRLTADNVRLRQTTLQQGAALQRQATLQAENVHLRLLLDLTQQAPRATRPVEIVRFGRDPYTHRAIIAAGAQHGVVPGQPAVDEHGVIGQVVRVFPHTSEIMLVTDRELTLPVRIERNGLHIIAFGHGHGNRMNLPYLADGTDIRVGDRLVTSGLDGIYPEGLAVARVLAIERPAGTASMRAVCEPLAAVAAHRQILLLSLAATPPPAPLPARPRPRHAPRTP